MNYCVQIFTKIKLNQNLCVKNLFLEVPIIGNNHGVTTTSSYIDGQSALGGKAIRFNDPVGGEDMDEGYPVKINAAGYSSLKSFTVSWWVYMENNATINNWDTMVALGNGNVQATIYGDGYLYGTYYGGTYIYVDDHNGFVNRVPDFSGRGQWHYHTLIFDGSKFYSYINGVIMNRDGITDFNFAEMPDVIWVGNEDDTYGTFNNALDGAIDDLKLYNYPMDALEVATEYTNVSGSWVCNTFPEFDFNNDCKVGLDDLAQIMNSWLDCGIVPDCIN